MREKKYDLEELSAYRLQWNKPCPDALPENKRELFMKRITAVNAYIDGYPLNEIEKTTGIHSSRIGCLVEKCISEKPGGTQYGYEGLCPGRRCTGYARSLNSSTTAGLFTELLEQYPELKDFILGNYIGDKKYTLERVMDTAALHKKFLIKCRDLGIGDDDYPFNTESKGERSLRQYLDRLQKEDSHIASQRISEDAKNMFSSIGTKTKYTRNSVIPYSCVQVDGHIIDIIYTTKVPLDDGTFASMECQRCWLFAVIDVATRCIIGYSLSQEYNYNQFDVLSGIKNSILKHTEIKENTLQLPMPENGGFPSTAFAELKNAMPDCIMLDNAKAHLSSNVIEKITNDLKCSMDFGPVSAPETRAIVERFFGTLERKGFHRLPATTGSIKQKSPHTYGYPQPRTEIGDKCESGGRNA